MNHPILVSVYDTKTELFSAPYMAPTAEAAIREFSRAVADPVAMADKFPHDYELFSVATFYQDSGDISPNFARLVCARDLLKG